MVRYQKEALYYGKERKETSTSCPNADGKRQIIQQLLQEYDIESAQDIQDALKDLLGGTIKEMMERQLGFLLSISV